MASSATDHLSKVNAFVSTAGNFIDSALDQLDDQLESAMGGMSEKVGEELREHSLTADAMTRAKATAEAWSALGFAALRDEWRDAAMRACFRHRSAHDQHACSNSFYTPAFVGYTRTSST